MIKFKPRFPKFSMVELRNCFSYPKEQVRKRTARGALQLLLNYCQIVKGKGKVRVPPINCHEDPKWGVEVGQ